MIQIVMNPDYAIKPKNGENCYTVMFNVEKRIDSVRDGMRMIGIDDI